MIEPNYLPFILIGGGIIFVVLFFHYVPFFLWLSAKVSGVRISLVQLFLMRIRNVPPYVIVPAMIEAHKAGLSNITRDELEAHYMAGGHVEKVVHALVSASKANIELSFQMATGIDLAGRDVFEAVQMSVNPKVIDTPPVTAVAKDGIQLIAKARVTVRANIRQLVGGAGEDTILARVGEGIVSSIGSSCVNVFLTTNGQASAVGTIVSAGYGFLCGAYMPIASFSPALRNIIMFLPGTYGTALVRNHALSGALNELGSLIEGDAARAEVLKNIKDGVDCNVYFFGDKVEIWVMYLVLAGATLLLLGLYVLLGKLLKKHK